MKKLSQLLCGVVGHTMTMKFDGGHWRLACICGFETPGVQGLGKNVKPSPKAHALPPQFVDMFETYTTSSLDC